MLFLLSLDSCSPTALLVNSVQLHNQSILKIMSAGQKRIALDEDTDDILCGLPKFLLDSILDRLLLKDAVRTSILSRKWRYLWTARTSFEFDKQFFDTNFKYKPDAFDAYICLIDDILWLRTEPVLKFSLYIPDICSDSKALIDYWLLFLSKYGINELELINMSVNPYKLPSCVFSSPHLKVLKFAKLESLWFTKMSFAPNACGGDSVPVLPVLRDLRFYDCRRIENFKFFAAKLRRFSAIRCHDVISVSFDKFPNLVSIIAIGEQIYEQGSDGLLIFVKFLKKLQNLKHIARDGAWLKVPAATLLQQRPPFMLCHLQSLVLRTLKFDVLDQIYCLIFLLRSSPRLQILDISTFTSETTALESVFRHLQASGCMRGRLLNLQKVKFVSVRISKPVMLILKYILDRSPSLHCLHFEYVYDKNEEKVFSNILRFNRASPNAEVTYSCKELASTKWANQT